MVVFGITTQKYPHFSFPSRSGYSLERSIAAAAEKIANAGAGLFVGNLPRRYTLTGSTNMAIAGKPTICK